MSSVIDTVASAHKKDFPRRQLDHYNRLNLNLPSLSNLMDK